MNTVKVRILVAVDPLGNWSASGWRDAKDGAERVGLPDMLESGETYHWVEADIPIPEVGVVQGTVTGDSKCQ